MQPEEPLLDSIGRLFADSSSTSLRHLKFLGGVSMSSTGKSATRSSLLGHCNRVNIEEFRLHVAEIQEE